MITVEQLRRLQPGTLVSLPAGELLGLIESLDVARNGREGVQEAAGDDFRADRHPQTYGRQSERTRRFSGWAT